MLAGIVLVSPGLGMTMPSATAQDNRLAAGNIPKPAGRAEMSPRDELVAQTIDYLMPRNHISAKPINDEISDRAFDLFIEALDPRKEYFYQSDVDAFRRYETKLDDLIRNGNLKIASVIADVYARRLSERLVTINELLDGSFDFDREESLITDPELLRFPASAAEARDRWRKKLKYELLDMRSDDIEQAKKNAKKAAEGEAVPPTLSPEEKLAANVAKLRRRYARAVRRGKDLDNDRLLEIFMTSVTSAYDPHSTYMSPDTVEDFAMTMRLQLDGIGAQLMEKDGKTTITRIIPGGAADKHGELKPDDVLVSVGQGANVPEAEMVDIIEMPLSDVVKMIRGSAGTQVTLGVQSGGVGSTEYMTITRARIELDESAARGEVIEHTPPGGGPAVKIGYINLPSFYLDMDRARTDPEGARSSTRDVRRILDDFRRKGVEAVVLDLGRNGGGSLTEAIALTGLFIDTGTVVQVKDSDGTVEKYPDDEPGSAWDGPLVVMTSKLSASASEILAGAIRDYRRGIVVGDPTTHGKGSVQQLMDLGERLFRNNRKNYGALKVTLQQFYLPDGESTQLNGVPADVVLPSLIANMDIGEADLKYALDFDRVPASRHSVYNLTPTDLVSTLNENSKRRLSDDPDFKDLERRIDLFNEQKATKQISLVESEFMSRRDELNARKEEEDKLLEAQLSGEKVYNDDFYNREVLNVTADYVNQLRQRNLIR